MNGQKVWTSYGWAAGWCELVVRTDPEAPKHKGLSVLLVHMRSPGIDVRPLRQMTGETEFNELFFSGVRGPVENVLGKVNDGWNVAIGTLMHIAHALAVGVVALSAELTGGMQKVVVLTVAYVKTRKQFGKPVGSYQLVQAMCADMPVAVESARSATYFAAYSLREGLPATQADVSVAQSYISDAARKTGNKAIQCHGGMGFTGENDVHLYYRRANASQTAYRDAAYHRERLAQLVL